MRASLFKQKMKGRRYPEHQDSSSRTWWMKPSKQTGFPLKTFHEPEPHWALSLILFMYLSSLTMNYSCWVKLSKHASFLGGERTYVFSLRQKALFPHWLPHSFLSSPHQINTFLNFPPPKQMIIRKSSMLSSHSISICCMVLKLRQSLGHCTSASCCFHQLVLEENREVIPSRGEVAWSSSVRFSWLLRWGRGLCYL